MAGQPAKCSDVAVLRYITFGKLPTALPILTKHANCSSLCEQLD